MNWTFWTRTPPTTPDDCGTINPLLSLYADGMANADEAHRVERHLTECAPCRESLAWARATQRALMSRAVALPPADLRARIAAAIAASSAAPVPTSFNVRRAFAVRPAYAAAASVLLLGLVSYGLLHTAAPQTAKTQPAAAPPAIIAAAPRVTPAPIAVKPADGPGVKLHLTPHAVPAPKHVRDNPDLVARTQPHEATPEPVVKTHSLVKAETKMLADAAPAMAPLKPHLATIKKLTPRKVRPEMMATTRIPVFSPETHRPVGVKPEPHTTAPLVATAPHTPTVSVPTFIEKAPIITPDPVPTTLTANNSNEGRFQTAGLIRVPVGQMHKFTHATLVRVDRGIAFAAHKTGSEEMGYIPGVYTPSR